ncbi:MAG: hypothetical protein HFJ91_03375 [Muribaculaceae bacterium]|nr:hypothetical protein [Muribaculaceae bacterium]
MATDFARLRLKHHGDPRKLHDILQQECRERFCAKLPTLCACPGFEFPSLAVAEMATSEAAAAIHASLIPPGAQVLDMTFGLGVDTIAIARRASAVTAIELDPTYHRTGLANIRALGLTNITLLQGDSLATLATTTPRHFDIIFADPARRDTTGRHFALGQCSPDLTTAIPALLQRTHRLIIKTSPMLDPTLAMRELGIGTASIHIIGTTRECKELLLDIPSTPGTTPAVTTTCHTIGQSPFTITPTPTTSPLTPAIPLQGHLLLEPYPSVMKATPLGSPRTLATLASPLHPNTHLFTAPAIPPGFPGQAFHIQAIHPFNKQTIRQFRTHYPKANLTARNFPLTVPALAARLRIDQGGHLRIFAATLADGTRALIVTTPL